MITIDRPFADGPKIPRLCCNWWGAPADALQHHLRGAAVFLCCGGPSLNDVDLSKLNRRGIVTATVNQCAATHVRPRFAFFVDPPQRFHPAIWRDAGVAKFTRRDLSRGRHAVRQGDGWSVSGPMVRDLPNVWFFEHGFGFRPEDFLTRGRVTWGADYKRPNGQNRGTRSVMLPALRLLYWMGARTVFLVGSDFRMHAGASYAFNETKDATAAGTNNNSYAILNGWFRQLRPHFEARDFHVFNCTPGSRLDAFDPIDYNSAVETVAAGVPAVDSVHGLYRL